MFSNFNKIFHRQISTTHQSLSVKSNILEKLNEKFGPNLIHAEVRNHGWKNNEPKESEKFLEVIVVTTEFEGLLKAKRADLIKNLLKNDIKDSEVSFKLLTPSKWYDSNQRGLKLPDMYASPPVLNGKLQEIAKKFYPNV